jgi:hypothetical protein
MKYIITLVALMVACSAYAGFRRDPTPHAIISPGGRFVFIMTPGPKGNERKAGSGKCFSVLADGGLKLIWETEGWYSEDIHLDHDGEVLARIGSWASGDQDHGKPEDGLALAFFRNGVLLKSYNIPNLVKDSSFLIHSESGLIWLKQENYVSPAFRPNARYQLTTVDGIEYTFDTKTGSIASTAKK